MGERIPTALRSPRVLAALTLFTAWGLFFLPHLFSDGVPYYRDNLLTILPFRQYIHERLLKGELPHWYPYEGLGVPFIGQIATSTFHPHSLLFLPLAPALAVKWNVLLSYLFALAGAYRLGRAVGAGRPASVTGAFAFAFGGYALGVSHNLVYLEAHATLVWVASEAVRLAQRPSARHLAAVAAAWALTFLSGDAQAFLTAPLLIAPALLYAPRPDAKTLGRFALAGALAAGLICVELLPALALSPESAREMGTRSPTMGLTWALHPLRALELLCAGFIPDEFRNRMVAEVLGGRGAVWATTVYSGALVLLLAVAGVTSRPRRVLGFAGAALIALWLSLGDYGGLLSVVVKVVPLFAKFRYPEKFLGLFWCALVPLVALGTDLFLRDSKRWGLVAIGASVLLIALAVLSSAGPLVEWIWAARGHVASSADPMYESVRSAWFNGFVIAAGFVGTAGLVAVAGTRAALLVPLLVFGDLVLGNGAHLPLVPREVVEAPTPFAEVIRQAGEPAPRVSRIVDVNVPSTVTLPGGDLWVTAMRRAFYPNTSGLERITGFGANTPAHTGRYARLFYGDRALAAATATHFHGCFSTVAPNRVPPGNTPVMQDSETGLVLARAPCAERAHFSEAVADPGEQQVLERLKQPFTSSTVAFWARNETLPRPEGTVEIAAHRPESVVLHSEASTEGLLVLNDLYAMGWEARVDGQGVAIEPVNVAARGVVVPAGSHEITFTYRTPRFGAGLILSALSLLALVSAVAFSRRDRANRAASRDPAMT